MSNSLARIVAYLDTYLDIDGVEDASLNGLQVEACDSVARVGVAVDAAAATIEAAVAERCDLLLVHHGLLFGGPQRITGTLADSVGRCFRAGISVYGAHLPLDLHAEVGNNVLLARSLGAEPATTFGDHGGVDIGTLARWPEPRPLAEVAGALAAAGCDDQVMWAFGPDPVETAAVVTGSGCSLLRDAIAEGADLFITGEPRHSAYHTAREARINCLFAGHYATEVLGVRAVARRLAEEFDIETVWIDHPTGV